MSSTRLICEKMSTLDPLAFIDLSNLSRMTILPAFSTRCSSVVNGGPGSAPSNTLMGQLIPWLTEVSHDKGGCSIFAIASQCSGVASCPPSCQWHLEEVSRCPKAFKLTHRSQHQCPSPIASGTISSASPSYRHTG